MDDEILRELQVQTSILRIAFKKEIESLSAELRGDELTSAIVEVLGDEGDTKTGVLWSAVKAAYPGAVRRTFGRRLAALAESGVLRRTGAGSSTSYELTGLVQ